MSVTWVNFVTLTAQLSPCTSRTAGIRFAVALLTFCVLSTPLASAELKVGVSFSIPPYVIQENGTGLEIEILQRALAAKGHIADIHYLPLARTFSELTKGKLDAIINTKAGVTEGVFYSDVVISFQNCAISLEKNHFNIKTIADLREKDVVAFQRASLLLGEEFGAMAKENPNYREQAKQLLQVYMLFKERTDVVVMDQKIFSYYLKQAYLEGKVTKKELQKQAICSPVFPPTDYQFAFLNAQIRDDFNAGLAQIRTDGTLHALQAKYERMMSLNREIGSTISLRLDKQN